MNDVHTDYKQIYKKYITVTYNIGWKPIHNSSNLQNK